MIIPASVITDHAREKGNRILRTTAENVPEVAAYFAHLMELSEEARAASRKVAAAIRDERIRWVRNQTWPQASGRRVAVEILRIASSLRDGETPRSEPRASVRKIIEYNGGLIPSERTIRAALRD